ncbi:hypothetical protein [Microbacterium oryzae]|nr:hypothetical protein [Microbacterium oryzae]
MTTAPRREGEGLPAGMLLAFAVAGYGALAVCGLGFGSLFTESDVIETPGVGIVPAALAVVVSVGAFALALWPAIRPDHPRFTSVIGVVFATAAIYALALWLLALVFGAGLGTATGAVVEVVIGWPVPVLAGAAAIASWCAIAVRRTRAQRPLWPWERPDAR